MGVPIASYKFELCIQIPITLQKEVDGDSMRCGFKIGGGIDQDYHKSPQGYTDNVSYLQLYTTQRFN